LVAFRTQQREHTLPLLKKRLPPLEFNPDLFLFDLRSLPSQLPDAVWVIPHGRCTFTPVHQNPHHKKVASTHGGKKTRVDNTYDVSPATPPQLYIKRALQCRYNKKHGPRLTWSCCAPRGIFPHVYRPMFRRRFFALRFPSNPLVAYKNSPTEY